MNNHFYKRLMLSFLCAVLLFTMVQPKVFAAGMEVQIYFNGKLLQFDGAKPVMKDGRALVPFRKLFETLGFTVKWNQTLHKAIGTKNNLTIELTIKSKQAKVNGKVVTLDVPAQVVSGSTMVPLRFVSENSGYPVSFKTSGSVPTITIGSGGSGGGSGNNSSTPKGQDVVEPYVVKGRVVDPAGKPVKGAEVFADNQLIYNSNLTVVTDANGYYRIELPQMATTWNMGGYHNLTKDGKEIQIELESITDEPFAGNTGAIRNFKMDPEALRGELYIYSDLSNIVMESDLLLTITPIISGKEGIPITKRGYNFPGGFGLLELSATGTYRISAQYAPEGKESIPAKVRVRYTKEYKESIVFEFKTFVSGIERAEIEVLVPQSSELTGQTGETQTPNPTTNPTINPTPNLTPDPTVKTGSLYFHWDIKDAFDNGYSDYEKDVIVTLTPIDSGKEGAAIQKKYEPLGISLQVQSYRATAIYSPPGQTPIPILISIKDKGEYKHSVEFGFTDSFGSYSADLEFKMP